MFLTSKLNIPGFKIKFVHFLISKFNFLFLQKMFSGKGKFTFYWFSRKQSFLSEKLILYDYFMLCFMKCEAPQFAWFSRKSQINSKRLFQKFANIYIYQKSKEWKQMWCNVACFIKKLVLTFFLSQSYVRNLRFCKT